MFRGRLIIAVPLFMPVSPGMEAIVMVSTSVPQPATRGPQDAGEAGAREAGAPVGPDGWVATDRSRARARWTALRRHPLLWLAGRVRPRRGLSRTVEPPTSENEILERVAQLPLSVWTYGFDDASVRHMGPMAQDFAAAFGLGASDRQIDMVDANGIALACIKALHRRVVELETQLAQLRGESTATKEASR